MKLLVTIPITILSWVVKGSDGAYFPQIQPTVQRNSDGSAASVSFHLNGKLWQLELTPAKNAESVTLYPVRDGSISAEEVDVGRCHYQGVITGNPCSKVALSICTEDQIHGEFYDGKDLYGLTFYGDEQYVQRYPQDVGGSSLGKSFYDWGKSVKKTTPVRFSMGDLIENTLFQRLDQSFEQVVDFLFSQINIINTLLAELQMVIDLALIEVWTDKNYIDIIDNSSEMLSLVESYISNQMSGRDEVDFVGFYTVNLTTEGVARAYSMGSSNKSGVIVRTDPYDVVINSHTMIHEFFHTLGVEHDQDTKYFFMATNTSNPANVLVSKESIVQLNRNMMKMMNRLLQKNQQWTPIDTCTDAKCEQPSNEKLLWFLIFAIGTGVVAVASAKRFYMVCCKCRRPKLEMAYKAAKGPEATSMLDKPAIDTIV